jgi:hypothetical protein
MLRDDADRCAFNDTGNRIHIATDNSAIYSRNLVQGREATTARDPLLRGMLAMLGNV